MRRFFPLLSLLLLLAACGKTHDDVAMVTKYLPVQLVGSDKWSIMDITTGEIVARDLYKNVPSAVVSDMYYVMNDKGEYDYYHVADPQHPVNAASFGSATPYSDDGLAVASLRGKALMVIDKKCNVVKELPANVAECTMYNHGRAAYHTDMGLWGYLDENGDSVIGAHYANANAFLYDDHAVVIDTHGQNDSIVQFSVIDRDGKTMFSASTSEYQVIQPFYVSGVLPVLKGDSMVCLDAKGNEVPNPNDNHQAVDNAKWDEFSRTTGGYFLVTKNGKMGLVDADNKVLIAPQFTRLIDVTADRYIAMEDSVGHLVDLKGAPVGKEKFVHAHGGMESVHAARGFIDASLAAANWLMLFDSQQCCGATSATTLMDMNSLLGSDPAPYVPYNSLVSAQGPFRVQFFFDKQLATQTDSLATFNYGARVERVELAMNVNHCGTRTEHELIDLLSSSLGTRGFVYSGEGVFASEEGPAVVLGCDQGIVTVYYYMNKGQASQKPQNMR